MTMGDIEKLAHIIRNSKGTVFFGGAGVSTESGVPDFRSERGLYAAREKYGRSPEEMLSRDFFDEKPELFFEYYKENLIHLEARPNAAHVALAKLEANGLLEAVITQNVDGLHQAAGSVNVIELHGANSRQYCVGCGENYALEYILRRENCVGTVPRCAKCGGMVRPDVVLYGEMLKDRDIQVAHGAIAAADCLIIGGTSLAVYPAAGLTHYFGGSHMVLINKSRTAYDSAADLVINESIGEVLAGVVRELRL